MLLFLLFSHLIDRSPGFRASNKLLSICVFKSEETTKDHEKSWRSLKAERDQKKLKRKNDLQESNFARRLKANKQIKKNTPYQLSQKEETVT